jgi:integrase/recombinase XerD
MPGPQPRLHLPYAQWPAADRELWEHAMGGDDPFEDAVGSRLAKTSQHQYLFAWRRYLGFLAIEEPSALEISPAERLSIQRIRTFATHLAESNTPRSVAIQVDALYKAARVMMPDHDWAWLKSVKVRLHAAAPSHPPTGPVITSVQLLDLGQTLMDESQPTLNNPIRMAEAVRFRDGLMIAVVAFAPLRRKNLAAIEIGRHLVQEGDDWFIIIPCEESKTGASIEFAIPELLNSYLATYLDIIRPRMLKHPAWRALWVSAKGGALSYSAIWAVITRHTASRLGVRIAPHDVRDAAATMWALAAPERIGIARDLLSHSDLRTTTKHYNRARGIEASRTHAQLIAGMRRHQKLKPPTLNQRGENEKA